MVIWAKRSKIPARGARTRVWAAKQFFLEVVEQYGVVTVADMFELAGITGNGYTDQNYGWTSTRAASVERTRHGDYIIKITRPCNIR